MQNRTLGIGLTVFTSLCCGCLALFFCIFGGLIASGQPVETTLNGVVEQQTYPASVGFSLICLSLIFIIIPIVVGFFTLRRKRSATDMPTPPAP